MTLSLAIGIFMLGMGLGSLLTYIALQGHIARHLESLHSSVETQARAVETTHS